MGSGEAAAPGFRFYKVTHVEFHMLIKSCGVKWLPCRNLTLIFFGAQ